LPWDIALSQYGDIVLSPSGDFEGVNGPGLVAQRIMNRLRVPRGSWVLDREGDFGSDVDLASRNVDIEKAAQDVPALIRQGLAPMNDIEVQDVTVRRTDTDPNALLAVITYTTTAATDLGVDVTVPDVTTLVNLPEPDPEEYVVVVPL
jgi:phage gp46-like protein